MKDGRYQAASALCLTVCFLWISLGRSIPEPALGRDGHGVPMMTFQVARITREPITEYSRFQLHLTGVGANLPTVYLIRHWLQVPERLRTPVNGTVAFYAKSSVKAVYLVHPRGYQGILFELNERSPTEQLLPDIEFSIQEGREVTFQRGNDADVNFFVSMEDNDQTRMSWVYLQGGMVAQSKTDEHVAEIYPASSRFPFQEFNQSPTEHGMKMHLRIKTSSGDVEGLLQLGAVVRFTCRAAAHSCLIGSYIIHEDVPLYQTDHGRPFPENYIGLKKEAGHGMLNQTLCRVHEPSLCQVKCEFVGDGPSAVEFVRVAGRLNPTYRLSASNGGFRAVGVLGFGELRGPGEAEYRCQSLSGSQEASHTVKVVVVHDARIRRDLTYATRRFYGTVEAACVAQGTPAPVVSLSGRNFHFSSTGGDVISGPYVVVMTNPNNMTSVARLRIRNPDVAEGVAYISCRAWNEIRGRIYTDHVRRYLRQVY